MAAPRFRLGSIALACATAAALGGAVPARGADSPLPRTLEVIDHDDADCLEPIPVRSSTDHLAGGDTISVDVVVLLDGVDTGRGASVMAKAAGSYEPLGITLRVVRFESVAFPPDEVVAGEPTIASQRLINLSKAHVGGRRPAGSDVVYTITAKEIGDAAGRADCIGGVRYPELAFAVGENYDPEPLPMGPVNFYVHATAKIAAHEIGHLLGAHHHYFNCAEGIPTEVSEREASPCTVMSPYIDLGSLNFGALEAAVVRGHAEEYAAP